MFVLVKLEKIFCLFIFLACTPWVYSAKSIPDYYFGFTSTVSKARTYLLHISNDGNSIAFGKKICFQLYRFYSAKYWSDWKIAHQEIKQIPYNNELALVIRISINNGLMPKYCRWGGGVFNDELFQCKFLVPTRIDFIRSNYLMLKLTCSEINSNLESCISILH